MRRGLNFALLSLFALGCPMTNPQRNDAGGDGSSVDAPLCTQGEPCDCRAALMIPAGTHWVGTDADTRRYVHPAHQVTLTRPLWLGTYEATAGCYAACARAGACTGSTDPTPSEIWPGLPINYWQSATFADMPIGGLEPEQADAYCAWLGGRLPTNAEYEKAIRGEDARSVPWAPAPADPRNPSEATDLCDHAAGMCGEPLPGVVDSVAIGRGPYGHFHVIGNMQEWVADGYEDYSDAPAIDPFTSPTTRDSRVIRSQLGQGWYRDSYEFAGSNLSGVRCAFDSPPAIYPR